MRHFFAEERQKIFQNSFDPQIIFIAFSKFFRMSYLIIFIAFYSENHSKMVIFYVFWKKHHLKYFINEKLSVKLTLS